MGLTVGLTKEPREMSNGQNIRLTDYEYNMITTLEAINKNLSNISASLEVLAVNSQPNKEDKS